MIRGIIYKYTSPSGKIYIGQTIDEYHRKHDHKSKANNGSNLPFHRAIRKYGWNSFDYKVIFITTSKSREKLKVILDTMESYYIRKYKSDISDYGYNCTSGGGTNHQFTEQTKEKMRKAHIGINAKQVYQYDLYGAFIASYSSLAEAEKETNVNKSDICNVCSGNINSAGGYYWSYSIVENPSIISSLEIRNGKRCLQLTLEGNLVAEYFSAREAAKITGFDNSSISKACRGNIKSYKGYIWKYK